MGGLLLPKLTLDCYQPVAEGGGEVPWDPSEVVDTSLTPKEKAKQAAKEKAKKRSLSQTLSTDRRLETRVDLISGEVKQFTGDQLAAGEAGFTFVKTRLIKMGQNIYPVAIPGVIDYCDVKNITYTILESSPEGYPIKLEVCCLSKAIIGTNGQTIKVK